MTTKETLAHLPQATGVVIDMESSKGQRKDGKPFENYRFQMLSGNGKHWYSTFDRAAWDQINKGEHWTFFYTESPNPNNAQYPYKNIEWWTEVTDVTPEQQATAQSAVAEATNSRRDFQRSKEEMRFTEAMHMAVSLFGNSIEKETPNFPLIQTWALELYEVIQQGTPEPEHAPEVSESPVDEPEGESEATRPVFNPEAAINESVRTWNHNNPLDKLSVANLEQVLIEVYKVSPAPYREMVTQLTFDQAVEFGKHIADGDLDALITFGSRADTGADTGEIPAEEKAPWEE